MIALIFKKIINFLNYQYSLFSLKKTKKGENCKIGKLCEFISPENIILGKGVKIANFVKIDASRGKVIIGDYTQIEDFSQIKAHKGRVEIGKHCTLNPFSIIDGGAGNGVIIKDGVRIAAQSMIISSNHVFEDPNEYIYKQGLSSKGILIEDDIWIASGCKILDGTTIGKGSVIAANAVVTKNIEPFSIVGGVPAKLIKKRI